MLMREVNDDLNPPQRPAIVRSNFHTFDAAEQAQRTERWVYPPTQGSSSPRDC
jgi:hypothetical protein